MSDKSESSHEAIDGPSMVPTPLYRVLRRARRDSAFPGKEFSTWVRVGESVSWYATSVLLSALGYVDRPTYAAAVRALVDTNNWQKARSDALGSLGRLAPREFRPITEFLTRNQLRKGGSSDFEECAEARNQLLAALRFEDVPFQPSWLGIVDFLHFLRNKTTGHGSQTAEWEQNNLPAVQTVVERTIANIGRWPAAFAYSPRGSRNGFLLLGDGTTEAKVAFDSDTTLELITRDDPPVTVGIDPFVIRPSANGDHLVYFNGNRSREAVEFLDVTTGDTERVTLPKELREAPPLARSTTAGHRSLKGNQVLHNLPEVPEPWVSRPQLEKQVKDLLLKPQQPMVAFHGIGGSGKTALALRVAWDLTRDHPDRYNFVIWLSARDLDLLPDLPTAMRTTKREVSNLEGVGRLFESLMVEEGWLEPSDSPLDTLADQISRVGENDLRYLVIADNFETLDDPAAVEGFFADHLLSPNKLLITSRLADTSQGSRRVDVGAMLPTEAAALIRSEARLHRCEGLLDDRLIEQIIDVTSGRPYALRLFVAQLARRGNPRATIQEFKTQPHVLDALFRVSFDALSPAAQTLVLVAGLSPGIRWIWLKSALSKYEHRLEDARAEAVNQALITVGESRDGEETIEVPTTLQEFAKREVTLSPLAGRVEEATELLVELRSRDRIGDTLAVGRAIGAQATDADVLRSAELEDLLHHMAQYDSRLYLELGRLRRARDRRLEDVVLTYREGLREDNSYIPLWLAWIEVETERDLTRAYELIRQAASLDTTTVKDLSSLQHLAATANPPRGLAETEIRERVAAFGTIASRLEEFCRETPLDGDVWSQMVWAHLNSRNEHQARKSLIQGLQHHPANTYLIRLAEKLDIDPRLGR